MQFLGFFLIVYAACCALIHEKAKEVKSEKRGACGNKKILGAPTKILPELDKLEKYLKEYYSVANDVVDAFNSLVLRADLNEARFHIQLRKLLHQCKQHMNNTTNFKKLYCYPLEIIVNKK
ncbi:hypothetical protein THOM_0541 [Trachipleistophora hominis]|uniref:Secreted protein n=1 Tax=Trachipleistophora hominis TaxID=72359 RepID=L7JYH1_TRAHO|nr:hypothetical protein THOM_0541 [Trachipleistophora hominis]